jgi:hypothetical protein
MRPTLELLAVHPKLAAGNFSDLLVDAAQLELSNLKAHRRAAVAAPTRLMEHDRTVRLLELLDQLSRSISHADAAGIHGDDGIQGRAPRGVDSKKAVIAA